ncbi:MAG: hypothetical protein QM486_12075 [Flavobacteriaceae bacterium]
MKKLATTLFGLFLVATSFANVKGQEVTKTQKFDTTTQITHKTNATLNQINKVMAMQKTAKGGPVLVVEGCASKCQDDL